MRSPLQTLVLVMSLSVLGQFCQPSYASDFHASVGFGFSDRSAEAVRDERPDEEENPAVPRLISELGGVVPGRVNTLALTFEIQDGWHVYWRGQNDTGFPIAVEFEISSGCHAGAPLWPAGKRYLSSGGILDYIYEGDEATLLIPLIVPGSVELGSTVTVKADVEWLVCREACIPGWATLEASFEAIRAPVGRPQLAGQQQEDFNLIRSTRARLPRHWTVNDAGVVDFAWEDGGTKRERLKIHAKGDDVRAVSFLPDEKGRVLLEALKAGTSKKGTLELRFKESGAAEAPLADEGSNRDATDTGASEPDQPLQGQPVIGVIVIERVDQDGTKSELYYRIETRPSDEP